METQFRAMYKIPATTKLMTTLEEIVSQVQSSLNILNFHTKKVDGVLDNVTMISIKVNVMCVDVHSYLSLS